MRAAVIKEHGPPNSIQIEERPIPIPRELEVLVRVKACGLNHLDVWVRKGVTGHRFPLPLVPGSDITGVVEKVGLAVARFKPGDRVIINPARSCGNCRFCLSSREHHCRSWGLLGETTDGGCQEYIAVSESQVFALPPQLTFENGACIPINYVTAWEMLVGKAKIGPGESILIHGAGSGVSVAAIQISKLFGLQIYVTSGSEEKLRRAKSLGAHRFIDTSRDSFVDSVRNHTGKEGVDIVVDHVGASTLADSIRCLRRGGRLVSCGATSGADVNLDWKQIFFKNIALLGSTYGPRAAFVEVLRHFERGALSPTLDRTVRLDQLATAHEALESRQVFGKIVLSMAG